MDFSGKLRKLWETRCETEKAACDSAFGFLLISHFSFSCTSNFSCCYLPHLLYLIT